MKKPKPACMLRLYPLKCSHCDGEFQGTYKQMQNAKGGGTRPFCSKTCRSADASKRLKTEVPMRGPCQQCGAMFPSRREALFCNMNCYKVSDRFKEVVADALKKAATQEALEKRIRTTQKGANVPCLHCQTEFYCKRETRSHKARLFCSRPCYRAYLAARYDRWIANPQSMSLPQAYDEFLDRHELRCLIEGCGWSGVHLSMHANLHHGIKAAELKRAAGFNLGTGLVGSELAQRFSSRSSSHSFATMTPEELKAARQKSIETLLSKEFVRYRSLEGKEHKAKAGIFTRLLQDHEKQCLECGNPSGHKKYCSMSCCSKYHYRQNKTAHKPVSAKTGSPA